MPPGLPGQGGGRRLIPHRLRRTFFGYSRQALERVTLEQALRHPNWSMGAKITVDSATLMNKGLEYIEAMRLYAMPCDKISIVVHRESIVHSLVEYCDNAMLAQMGTADMRLPIQYALTWPARTDAVAGSLDLLSCPPLTFAQPDLDAFPCLRLAMDAQGPAAPPPPFSTAQTRRRWAFSWRGRSALWTFPPWWSGR